MGKKPGLSSTISTRERILAAATRRFASQSYDQTGLRDIAADAGVDVAYVHRSFGSKQQLFAEVIRSAARADHHLDDLSRDLVAVLTHRALARTDAVSFRDMDPLSIAVHSLSCPEAIEVHHEFVVNDLIEPLARHLDGPGKHRAALMVAFMTGFSILKNVVGIKELQDAEDRKIAPMVRDVFEALAGASAPPPEKSASLERRRK